jgi:hypothetical protein
MGLTLEEALDLWSKQMLADVETMRQAGRVYSAEALERAVREVATAKRLWKEGR